jgi:hypothetical protein
VDPRAGWFQYGLLQNFGSDPDFDTIPSPLTPNTPQNLPSSCEVASPDQASSSNPAGTTEVDPLLPYPYMPHDPLLFAWSPVSLPPSLPTQPTTPGLTINQPSPASLVSPQPLYHGPSPSPAAQQPNKVAKRPRNHFCLHAGCSYSCALPKDLRKHTLTHSPPTIKCPNKDNGCPRVFRRHDQCSRHVVNSCRYRLQPPGSSTP